MATVLAFLATAADSAFYAIFGLFVLAMVVLIVVVLTWAIRRDKAGRAAWVARRMPPEDWTGFDADGIADAESPEGGSVQ